MVIIIEILKNIKLFESLEETDLQKIAEVIHERTLPPGTDLFREGDIGEAFYLLKEGAVEIFKRDGDTEKLVNTISSKDESNFFGEMSLIEGAPRNATIRAKTECKILEIDKINFDMMLRINSFIALRIMTALTRRIRKESSAPASGEPEKTGKIITLFSPKGGSGKSVTAANLAAGIAKLAKKTALLIDLDLQFGDLVFMLGLKAKKSIADLIDAAPDSIEEFKTFIVTHPLGFSVLPSPFKPEQSETITSNHLRKILKLAQKEFDYIVIDTHSLFQDLTINSLDVSDIICMIMAPEMNHIKSMHLCLKVMENLKYPTEKIRLILNREESMYAKSREEIEGALKRKFDFCLRDDWKSSTDLVNDQKTIFDTDAQSKYRSDMVNFISGLTGEKIEEAENKGFLGSIKKLFG